MELERQLVSQGHRIIAGVDEVGRGSLAGPVVAAAVILPLGKATLADELCGVRDSKELTSYRRDRLVETILETALSVSVGWQSHHIVDREGIAEANRRAMRRAVARLSIQPDALLIDYVRIQPLLVPQLCVTRGDSLSLSIAAASIVAKVFRDRWMARCDLRFPGYGFAQHKGYGTAKHLAALQEYGPSPVHRRSFAPVASCPE